MDSVDLVAIYEILAAKLKSILCVRMQPYQNEGRILLDFQSVILIPEIEDYQVKF